MALLDDMRKGLEKATPAPAGRNSGEAATRILGAKATGKAGGPARKVSNVQERAGEAAGSAAVEEANTANAFSGAQLQQGQEHIAGKLAAGKADLAAKKQDADQKRTTDWQMTENARLDQSDRAMAALSNKEQMSLAQMTAQYDSTVKELASSRGIAEDDIFEHFRQGNEDLADREDAAELEQLGFVLRMRDSQYGDTLIRVGKVQGLEDELAFRKESARLRTGDATSLLVDELGFLEMYNQDERAFAESMNDMSLEQALKLSEAAARDASESQLVNGITKGAQVAYSYEGDPETAELDLNAPVGGPTNEAAGGPVSANVPKSDPDEFSYLPKNDWSK